MIQVESVERPFTDPDLAMPAFEVCKRAYAMGLLDDDTKVDLNVAGLREILRVVFEAGIGRDAEVHTKTLGPEFDAAAKKALLAVLASVMDAMEVSPAPDSAMAAADEGTRA